MAFPHHLLPLWARGGRSREEDQLSCRPRNAAFGGHPWALQADSRSSGLSKSRIPALDSISFLWGPLFPHLSKKLSENWGEGWETLQVKVLYDPHKPGRPTECLCLRTQEAEPSTPILLYCKPPAGSPLLQRRSCLGTYQETRVPTLCQLPAQQNLAAAPPKRV